MKNYDAKDVDEYIAGSAKESQHKLRELRSTIKSTVPKAEEKISWGIPFYRYHGALAGYAAFKNHVSFGMGGPRLSSKDREMLEEQGYKTGTKIIQIRFDQKLPTATIKKLLKSQAMMNEAAAK